MSACRDALLPIPGDEATFVARYGGVYESSPWVAREAWARGDLPAEADAPVHVPIDVLAARLAAVVEDAGRERQLALIRAHPDLAGKASVAGTLTEESTAEQQSAGLDQCTPEEYERFQRLNEAYHRRFGCPFVMAVRGASRGDILAAFGERLGNAPETEFRRALDEIHRIARLRLDQMSEQPRERDPR
ncbi:2-oxo-4-hydroxy-4-carboxy-5-ureidoimidazoline decarboxylase [Lentisalinibacter sediminis]|uniref:2-oxo-4-hydroxy-4-carboxy-5-ureidoimidazoline decarboxylase n=1 Tax=Lentisalinibacter sediminis TaxID=2992237 RepID=UPI003868B111